MKIKRILNKITLPAILLILTLITAFSASCGEKKPRLDQTETARSANISTPSEPALNLDLSACKLLELNGKVKTISEICRQQNRILLVIWQPNCSPCYNLLQALRTSALPKDFHLHILALGYGDLNEIRQESEPWQSQIETVTFDESLREALAPHVTVTPSVLLLDERGHTRGPLLKAGASTPDEMLSLVRRFLETTLGQ